MCLESIPVLFSKRACCSGPLTFSGIQKNKFKKLLIYFIKSITFAIATWKDLRLIATTEKNAKAIVLFFALYNPIHPAAI
jgi:hypothetical protein